MNSNRAMAMTMVLVMLLVAIVPFTYSIDADDQAPTEFGKYTGTPAFNQEPPHFRELLDNIMNASSQEEIDEIVAEYTATYGAEYGELITVITFITLLAIAAAGGMIGFVIGYNWPGKTSGMGDNDDIKEYAQTMMTSIVKAYWDSGNMFLTYTLPNDANMVKYASTYFQRAMEYTIYNYWSKDQSYAAEFMLEESGVRENIRDYIWSWQKAIDKVYDTSFYAQDAIGSDSGYDGMRISIDYAGSSRYVTSPTSSDYIHSDFSMMAYTGSDSTKKYVYFDNEKDNVAVNDDNTFRLANTVYLMGPSSAVMKSIDGRTTINLTAGKNVLDPTTYKSGIYSLETPNAVYVGEFQEASEFTGTLLNPVAKNAVVKGGMAIVDGDSIFGFATMNGDDVYVYNGKNSGTVANDIKFVCTYKDADDNTKSQSVNVANIVKGFSELVDSCNYAISSSSSIGQVTWNIFDTVQASNSYVHPSTIAGTFSNVTMSNSMYAVNYISAMESIKTYYETNAELLKNMEISVDKETENFIMLGDISYNGQVIVENAVFTPTVYVKTQHFKVGEETVMAQTGYATVWSTSATSLSGWTGFKGNASSVSIVPLTTGTTIEVKEMMVRENGETAMKSVTEFSLEVPKMIRDVGGGGEDIVVPAVPKVADATLVIIVMMLSIALNVFLLGYVFNQPIIGLAVALLIAAVGLIFPDTIASLFTGDFDWFLW